MIIYQVHGFVEGAQHAQFFTTKKEAEAYLREAETSDFVDLDIEAVHVTPNRKGLVKALNDFVEITCFNEERG